MTANSQRHLVADTGLERHYRKCVHTKKNKNYVPLYFTIYSPHGNIFQTEPVEHNAVYILCYTQIVRVVSNLWQNREARF
jgi:hypothetical protein